MKDDLRREICGAGRAGFGHFVQCIEPKPQNSCTRRKHGTCFVAHNCTRHPKFPVPSAASTFFFFRLFSLFVAEYPQLIWKDRWLNEAVLICHICCVPRLQDLSPYSSIHPSFKRALPVFFPISLVTASFTHLGDLWCLRFYCICDWYAWETSTGIFFLHWVLKVELRCANGLTNIIIYKNTN